MYTLVKVSRGQNISRGTKYFKQNLICFVQGGGGGAKYSVQSDKYFMAGLLYGYVTKLVLVIIELDTCMVCDRMMPSRLLQTWDDSYWEVNLCGTVESRLTATPEEQPTAL